MENEKINENEIKSETKTNKPRTRSRAKIQPKIEEVKENINILYLKGIEVKETIILDESLRHNRNDCVVFESKVTLRGNDYKKIIKFNQSRSMYQGLVGVDGGVRSLSFFPHIEHAQKSLNTYLERMM